MLRDVAKAQVERIRSTVKPRPAAVSLRWVRDNLYLIVVDECAGREIWLYTVEQVDEYVKLIPAK